MQEVLFCLISLFAVWFVVSPLFVAEGNSADDSQLAELDFSEKADLERFIRTIQFERDRGLISEADMLKLKDRAEKRLLNL